MHIKSLLKYFSLGTLSKIYEELKYYAIGLYNRIDQHHLFLSGGGIAFSLFASILPLTLIAFSILGNILDNTAVEVQLTNILNTIIPYPEYAQKIHSIIMSRVPEVIQYKTWAGITGAFGLLFISSGLFSSLRTILNSIFHFTDDKHMLIGKLRDLGMVILLVIFLFLAIIGFPALNILTKFALDSEILKMFRLTPFVEILFSIGSTLIILIMFYIFYKLIPYAKLGRRVPFVAALTATILWEIARQLFGYYISSVATLDRIYGTYALLVIVAFWIYYSSILFLVGAEVGQLYRERKTEKQKSSYETT